MGDDVTVLVGMAEFETAPDRFAHRVGPQAHGLMAGLFGRPRKLARRQRRETITRCDTGD